MDFASLLSKEIAKAKVPDKKAPSTTDSSTATTSSKYISRREAEAQREAAYKAEQEALAAARAEKAAAKRRREEEVAEEARAREEKRRRLAEDSRRRREEREAEEERARRRRLGLPEVPPSTGVAKDDDDEGHDGEGEAVEDSEARERLRALGEPAVLFGETRGARARRMRRAAMTASRGPIATSLQPVEERDMKVDGAVPKDKAARKWLYRQLASYFNMVLREWEIALAEEGAVDTTSGKAAIAAMVQSKETMKPMFHKFEIGDLDDTILEAIVGIVKAAQERRYLDANDGYLQLSIGKAAWPIGVTMVGIHERSAREKLHNGERGHVMGDEVTRKYLQSIKRCLTFAQVRWPPEDLRQLMG